MVGTTFPMCMLLVQSRGISNLIFLSSMRMLTKQAVSVVSAPESYKLVKSLMKFTMSVMDLVYWILSRQKNLTALRVVYCSEQQEIFVCKILRALAIGDL